MSPFRVSNSVALVALSLCLAACGGAAPTQPAGAPPTPESVTQDQPGGDAYNAHEAALTRQTEASWGWKTDRDQQARFPLPDRKNWKRVRFMLIDHFVGFKYGDDQHTLVSGFIVPMPKDAPKTSAACVEQFEKNSMPQVTDLGGRVSNHKTHVREWKSSHLIVREATGTIRFLGVHYEASLAWAGYPAYPDACLVYAVAVPWDGSRALAEKVRDKWTENFFRFRPLTETTPFRHE